MTEDFDKLGEPDLKLAGFQLWIHGRQFPHSEDYWDSNWLNITAHCEDKGASVWVRGPIIHLPEVAHLLRGAEQIYTTLIGEAELPCMEPELELKLTAAGLGHIKMEVDITPDNLTQQHHFIFDVDQSYLPALLTDCRRILTSYPIKGKP